ncbi:FecR family protein [Brevundimonas sp. R86498]|uniref:FecR family protein n=1 Tax=Brevundimonas sp. R86498 TaxID=3093845 RepID=UPI0037CB01A1
MIDRLKALFDRRPATAEDWLARMSRPDVDARLQDGFMAWLEADPEHLARYEQAKADSLALEPLRPAFAADLARLDGKGGRTGTRTLRGPGWVVLAGGAAALAVAVTAVLVLPVSRFQGRLYQSAPTQILDVTLADGSRVTLDAGSAIRVAIEDDVRRVELERGAAYFEVAHAADRPFQVGVAEHRVIVTGTRFVTALTPDGGEVSLLEGRVSIGAYDATDRGSLAGAVVLLPGQRVKLTPDGPGRPEQVDVETTTAWRERRLVFRDTPISEVVAVASRYADRPLVVADARLARTRVTAVLPISGEGSLITRMDRLLPISVENTPDGRALIRAE